MNTCWVFLGKGSVADGKSMLIPRPCNNVRYSCLEGAFSDRRPYYDEYDPFL
jgi:hypothetical protein